MLMVRNAHYVTAYRLCFLLILFVSSNTVLAKDEPQDSRHFSEGLFWQIRQNGEVIGHIFGTFHSNDERVMNLLPVIKKTLIASSSFSMEAFPGARYFNPHWGFKNILDDMMLPNSQTLSDLVGKKTYDRIEKLLKEKKVSSERIPRLRPWAAMNELGTRKFHVQQKRGDIMDHVLYELAASHMSDLYQVETLEELMAAYYDFPIDAQIGLLRDRLEAYDSLPEISEMMTEAYLREDLRKMLELSTRFISKESSMKSYDKIYLKHVLNIRNIVMAHYMLAPLRRKSAFIAIGALHLYGDEGILSLLEGYGYTSHRVSIKPPAESETR